MVLVAEANGTWNFWDNASIYVPPGPERMFRTASELDLKRWPRMAEGLVYAKVHIYIKMYIYTYTYVYIYMHAYMPFYYIYI